MDINSIVKNADPNIIIFLLTTLVAIISWVIKSLVERPIIESKETFHRFFDKRIEVLCEVKTRLNLIAYFPKGPENLEYKNQIQELLLKQGKSSYLNKDIYDNVLKISITPETNQEILISTIKKIDEELYQNISKIQDEVNFYRRFSNYDPLKRFVGITLLYIQYIVSLLVVISVITFLGMGVFHENICIQISVFIGGLFILFFSRWWLKG